MVSSFEKFLEDMITQRMFSRIGTVGGPSGRMFWFCRRQKSAWKDTSTETVARKKNQSSMEEGLARDISGFGGGGGASGETWDANGGEQKKSNLYG